MTYPNQHLLLTAHWVVSGATAETGQCGLRFDSTTAASQALVDACATAWSNFWTAATNAIDYAYGLAFLRLASIAPDGRYVPGSIAYDHTFPGTVPGGGSGGAAIRQYPLQVACVSSLLTAMPRGQAHRGRIYLPYLTVNLGAGWLWPGANVNNRTNGVSAMISALNTVLPGDCTVFSKGTKSAPTVGAKQLVTGVVTGTRPDVQRRRAKQLAEGYSILGNVTT